MARRRKMSKNDQILKAIGGLTEAVQLLVNKEIKHGESSLRGDGREGVPTVSSLRADAAKVRAGLSVARPVGTQPSPRGNDGAGYEARRRAEEQALNQGVENAVSSYRPANDPLGLPARSVQVKLVWGEGEKLACGACKKVNYVAAKDITTTHRVVDLIDLLLPYSEAVPALTAETPVNQNNGVSIPCQLCGEEWGVVIL